MTLAFHNDLIIEEKVEEEEFHQTDSELNLDALSSSEQLSNSVSSEESRRI